MRYLPIFGELFESDSIIFMLIGLILTVIIGIIMNDIMKGKIGLIISFVLYAGCELAINITTTNWVVQFILLFAGTIAIGGIIGFLISIIVVKKRKR